MSKLDPRPTALTLPRTGIVDQDQPPFTKE